MTDPLFIADLATLKTQLRLSGVPASATDTNEIINQAILHARLAFYRRLGGQRVTTLLAIGFVDNPTTDDEILRAIANQTEATLVMCYLLRHLPHAWMDASGDINKRWNDEAPFREVGTEQVAERVTACESAIEENMQLLDGSEDIGDEVSIQTFDGTPDCPTPRIGLSLRGSSRRVTEDPS